ncbi:hypothetical protein DDB_G0284247 [Dictyostelium discoideum AX4]|uniref:Uncharacterized protein n=1 Tax=Dictyostelium discoideum TaxID=44689 RepID=Q54PX2_DICDI|nr:hypothetical protein DDB_G0284247 [Dictyostelium discoideum AX4]EAL65312.1 hypothetical protein DDB_G0284247 [Dictyostelium discoideum AX4]|eukprot:XP_638673.1 hypothetical protein DDB_G0284247 [Dictyostelium discoideum AX4]
MSNHDNNNNTTSVNNNGNSIKTIKENIQACMEIYYHLKSTLGPFGRDKLIVDKNNNYLSTNDGATILQYLKITHPAPRLLIGIAKSQDETVGDGTTSVVLLTCILLQNALKFILLSIHPIIFIKGYQISLDFCLNVINEIKISPIKDNKNNEEILKKEEIFENEEFLKHLYSVASTSISSKILARYSDHFSKIGVEAVKRLKFNETQDLIRVIGITGNSMLESQLIDGILLEIDRNQLTTFKIDQQQQQSNNNNNNNKENEKIKSILKNPSIIIGKLQLNKTSSNQFQGLNLSIPHYHDNNNKNNNNNYNDQNKEQRDKIELLIKKGINIVISDTEISPWIELIFKENNILYFNIPDSRELEIISHCINCSLIYDLSSLSLLEDEKEKQSSMISKPNSIEILPIGDKFFLKISLNGDDDDDDDDNNNNNNKQLLSSNGATMLLRSPTDTMLQECIRSFKDMLNILSATVRNPYLIGGGGCTYIELSKRLRNKANEFITDEKLLISINCFADSLEMIPMILIQNAGYDSLDLLGKLKLVHKSTSTTNTTTNPLNNIWKGVNLNDGTIVDMISDLNVKEPSFLLSNILTLSSRAAQMILRINNNIFIEPRSQFKIPNQL